MTHVRSLYLKGCVSPCKFKSQLSPRVWYRSIAHKNLTKSPELLGGSDVFQKSYVIRQNLCLHAIAGPLRHASHSG